MTPVYDEINEVVQRHGLVARGGFVVMRGDDVPDASPGLSTDTVVMVGNTGPSMWGAFEPQDPGGRHPLDTWTRSVIEPIAQQFAARAVYPFDRPALPFQRWAAKSWPLAPSPLGLLIDSEFGLWHALRAALLFSGRVHLPASAPRRSPCASCILKPCLSACPVAAYSMAGFEYPHCLAHLQKPAGSDCMAGGCRARAACPVGAAHRYGVAQTQFHMRAYSGTSATAD